MESEFRALLLNDQQLSQLVGNRVSWVSHPQGKAFPAVVLTVISLAEGLSLEGRDGLSAGRVQVDCYARTYTEAKQVSRAVVSALHGHRGGGFRVVAHVGTRDSREGGTNEAERLFRVSLDFTTSWRSQ